MNIDKRAIKALTILEDNGYEAYLVGGCIRDMLLNKDINDYDITTNASCDNMKDIFKEYKVIETGIKHGTLTIVIEHLHLEITTYRIDKEYLDNRRPSNVEFTDNLYDDISRRDFTINSIAMDKDGNIIDYYHGQEDIDNKIIKTINNPNDRFKEDALRILRALRFSSTLGFDIEDNTKKAILDNKELLHNIAYERIKQELDKLICGKYASKIIKEYIEVIGIVIPELLAMNNLEHHNKYHYLNVLDHSLLVMDNVKAIPKYRWLALLHDVGKPLSFSMDDNGVGHCYGHAEIGYDMACNITKRLRFNNEDRYWLCHMVKNHMRELTPSKKAIKRFMNRYSPEMFLEMMDFKKIDHLECKELGLRNDDDIEECIKIAHTIIKDNEALSIKDLDINGRDIMTLGLKEKEIGQALTYLFESVIDDKVLNNKDKLINYLKLHLDSK